MEKMHCLPLNRYLFRGLKLNKCLVLPCHWFSYFCFFHTVTLISLPEPIH
uniref:Uncharacterized protein n=1 Tax=Arundo donax TaxID=35708 RepID=A0A0A8YFD5_ARUDO